MNPLDVSPVPSSVAPGSAAGVLKVLWLLVLLSVFPRCTEAQPVAPQSLWEHFFVDGCSFPQSGNLTMTLPLSSLTEGGGEFFLELDIYGPHTPKLVASSDLCTLPSSSLFRVSQTGKFTQTFTKIPDEADDEMMKDEEGVEGKGERGVEAECDLPSSNSVTLRSGYGFVSCRGLKDLEQTKSSLRAWKAEVQEMEAKAAATRSKIMGGVGGGMALLLLGCALCVVVRVRSSRRPTWRDRRPSQQSIRTRLTNDTLSSSHNTANKITH